MKSTEINDLRSAIEYLKGQSGQYAETSVEADPLLEIASVYRHVGAGGTTPRPTKEGPAVQFTNIKGFPGHSVCTGVLASRERMALLLGHESRQLGQYLLESVEHPIMPIMTQDEQPLCQQVVHTAEEPGFDVRKLIPVTQFTEKDGGPCITMGLCRASDLVTGESDVTIHRIFYTDKPDELTISCQPGTGRHIGAMLLKAEEMGKPLPISVNIGLDPAIYLGACFAPPTTPLGYDELGIAGALRQRSVELTNCVAINCTAIANAEYVIEGEIIPLSRQKVGSYNGVDGSIPEFPGYVGGGSIDPVIKVKAVTHRVNPIYEMCIGCSEEHVSMAGIPMEASIMDLVNKTLPGQLKNVYAPSCGGGKYMAILQMAKSAHMFNGMARQLALQALSVFKELKHVIVVDEDVDIFDMSDVMWALNFRYQGDIDTLFLPGVLCHPADPTADPGYSPFVRTHGCTCKTIFDCTIPIGQEASFERAQFTETDWKRFFPELV